MKPGVEALRTLPALGECGADLLGRLNDAADLVRVGPDEELFRCGEVLQEVTFLLAGHIGATHTRTDGKQSLVDVLQPVRPLCLASALLGLPAPAGARTFTTTRLIVFPVPELRATISGNPALGQRLLDYSLQETLALTQEIYAFKLHSAVQRLAEYLLGRVTEGELSPARFVLPF
ncbi:MAG TPA: Crp/Fnr family transcriptional regulator, partial [Acetobacteraceae bacterium]